MMDKHNQPNYLEMCIRDRVKMVCTETNWLNGILDTVSTCHELAVKFVFPYHGLFEDGL